MRWPRFHSGKKRSDLELSLVGTERLKQEKKLRKVARKRSEGLRALGGRRQKVRLESKEEIKLKLIKVDGLT